MSRHKNTLRSMGAQTSHIDESDGVCTMCGKIAELRPYGVDCTNICFPCGMLDEPATTKRARAYMFPEDSSEGHTIQ